MIHRDLKPGNVLIDHNGAPKVTDFGLAKRVEGDSDLTATGQILGTPGYMPPEQASGKVDAITESADVYSLGAILYALLTSRPPFQADNALDTLMQVLDREPIPPRQLNSKVPQDLDTICLTCIEKDPHRRYPSSKSLVAELLRFVSGEPIKARPISHTARAWRWCKRKPIVASLLTAVVISLIGGTTVASFFAYSAKQQTLETQQQLRRAETLLYANTLKDAVRSWDSFRAREAWNALASTRENLRKWEYDYVLNRFLSSGTTLLADVERFVLRPDRSSLLFVDKKGAVSEHILGSVSEKVWPYQTSQRNLKEVFGANLRSNIALSPDGRYMAAVERRDYAGNAHRIRITDAASGKEEAVLEDFEAEICASCFVRTASCLWSRRWMVASNYGMLTRGSSERAADSIRTRSLAGFQCRWRMARCGM